VEPVGEDAGEQAEEHVRRELREGHHADVERRVRELEDEPAERDPLHPRARLGDDLTAEEEAVVPVAEAVEGAPRGTRHACASRPTRCASGSAAAPTAASSAGARAPSLLASHAVRRERTRRSVRWPSSVSVNPTPPRSAPPRARATGPSPPGPQARLDT